MKVTSAVFTALFCLTVSLIILVFYPQPNTQVISEKYHCIIRETHFDLQWQHSVEKTLWRESYLRKNNGFFLIHTDLISFGAGTPSDYPIISKKDGFIRMAVNKNISEINWIVSRNMQGQLLWNKKTWFIAKDLPDYSLVRFISTHTPLWKIWWLGEC